MQLTKTEYNKELLEKWRNEGKTEEEITELFNQYVRSYEAVIRNKTQRVHFENYVKGLMSNLDRKSIEPIALAGTGEKGVRSMQQFITRSTFDDDAVLEEYQKMLGNATASKNGMLSTDGSDFLKKGKNSAGVGRQYCGRYGKTDNCQAGVFCAYAGENGYGLVDRELYLPKDWFDEEHKELREKCGIPEDKVFQTKNEIALELLKKAVESGSFNVKWIGCDAAFGCDHNFLDSLPGDVWYFAGTNGNERVFLSRPEMKLPDQPKTGRRYKYEVPSFAPVQVKEIAADDTIPWQRVLFEGSKGSVYADFKCIRCVSCRTATAFGNYIHPHTDVWLYIRRYENNDVKYFLSNAPENIELSELHEAATLRWPIEQCFEECKSYLGMGHFEGRSYPGFLRHLLFVMIAHFFITSLRLELKKKVSLSPCPWA
jgi:SRSO17 transposase